MGKNETGRNRKNSKRRTPKISSTTQCYPLWVGQTVSSQSGTHLSFKTKSAWTIKV